MYFNVYFNIIKSEIILLIYLIKKFILFTLYFIFSVVGLTAASLAQLLPPVLDQDLSSVGILLEEGAALNDNGEGRGDSGELTPISASASSEFDFDGIKYEDEEEEVEPSADLDITVVETLPASGDAPKDTKISKDRLDIDTRNRSERYIIIL